MIAIRAVLAAAAAASVCALAACAAPGPAASGTATPSVSAPVGAAPTGTFVLAGPGAPVEFVERIELPPCGHEDLALGEQAPTTAVECLQKPGGGELIVTAPTDEGDPTVFYYRALPEGGIEYFVDMTQDALGAGWEHALCPDATTIRDLEGCAVAPENDHEMKD